MSSFTVEAIPESLAAHVREQGEDPVYHHPTHTEPAAGYGPCRLCLMPFEEGEPRALFTLDAFEGTGDPPRPGPVFIHAGGCERHAGNGGFPEELRFIPLVLEGHRSGGWLTAAGRVPGDKADAAIAAMLEGARVDYVQIRNADAGCYIARAVRA